MATVKEHLRKVHETFAEHHRAMSKHHSAAMGKESDQKEFHKAAAAAHDAAADAHESMCNECAKAIESDLNKLIPTAISGVTPDRPRITAVPRYGQPQPPVSVLPEFEKVFGLSERPRARKSLES
jgi:hypothetical protein